MIAIATDLSSFLSGLAERMRDDDGISLVGMVLALVAVAVIIIAAVVAFVIPGDN